jgi:hypothetical protein
MAEADFLNLRSNLAAITNETHLAVQDDQTDLIGFTLEGEDIFPVNVFYNSVDDEIVLFTGLGAADFADRAAILHRAMELNAFAAATKGSVIGFDAATGRLNFTRVLPLARLETPDFLAAVKRFVIAGVEVFEKLREIPGTSAGDLAALNHA